MMIGPRERCSNYKTKPLNQWSIGSGYQPIAITEETEQNESHETQDTCGTAQMDQEQLCSFGWQPDRPSNITSVLDWLIQKKKVELRWTSCLHEIFEVEWREKVSGCMSSPKHSKPKNPQHRAWWGTVGYHEKAALGDDHRHVWDHLE